MVQNIDVIADLAMNYIRLASMCALLSLGTFFLFRSFESVLFWKYYKRDTSGATLCDISNSNAVVSRPVEISTSGFFLPFVVIFKSVKLRNFDL